MLLFSYYTKGAGEASISIAQSMTLEIRNSLSYLFQIIFEFFNNTKNMFLVSVFPHKPRKVDFNGGNICVAFCKLS